MYFGAWGRKMEEFVKSVVEQIRWVRVRENIAKELSDHIADQAAAYEENGTDREEALRRAVREMGDPIAIGAEFDRIHRPQTDYILLAMTVLFSLAGMLVLYTAGGLSAAPEVWVKQCITLPVSFVVIVGIYFLDYSFIGRHAYAVYGGLTAVFIVSRLVFTEVYGMLSQEFMLGYLFVPVYAGILYRLRQGGYGAVVKAGAMQLVTVAVVYGFTRTMHAAISIFLICLTLLVIAIWKGWFVVSRKRALAFTVSALVIVPAAYAAIRLVGFGGSTFFVERLRAYFNPSAYSGGAGFFYEWIETQLAGVRFFGASWDDAFYAENSMGTPYVSGTTPFIVLNMVCRYGAYTGVILLAAFAVFILRAFRIVRKQSSRFGFMMSVSCVMVFAVNCVEGILINTGRYPLTSMQLPFISYGIGTTLTYAVLIGLLLSVHRHERIACVSF